MNDLLKKIFSILNILTLFLDFLGAVFLSLYALIVGPLGFLRGPLVLERAFSYVAVLLPRGLLAKSVRIAIDWRLGQFDMAISQAESLITQVEDHYKKVSKTGTQKRVLMDFYTLLARAYLHTGRIDAGMQVVIRAKKVLGIDRLLGLAELDAKTANLVRAGLAAGKLLEGGGLATMFVKSDLNQDPSQKNKSAPPKRQGAVAKVPRKEDKGKLIYFPRHEDPK